MLICAAAATAQETAEPVVREGRGEREMVLIHGLGTNATIWEELLTYLDTTFDCWTYELHGHGQTDPMADPTIEKEAEALGQYLKKNDIPYPVLVGHGLGGLVAMRYTLDHPRDVKRLVVMDVGPKQLATPEEKSTIAAALIDDYDRFVATHYINTSPRREIADRVVDLALKTDSASFISLLMSSFDLDYTEDLGRQAVPILVVGSAMLFPTTDQAQAVLQHLGYGSARAISFKHVMGSGHYIMLEQPAYLASVLLAFGAYEEFR